MQAIMETLFDAIYLFTVIIVGVVMVKRAKGDRLHKLFGLMAIILGCGDAFHLIPRAYALLTTGLEANAAALGLGKLITSITMTAFYVILYHIWRLRYHVGEKKGLTAAVYLLAGVRILLCCFPQNGWFQYHAPLSWGIARNIPFAILGILIIVLFFREARRANDKAFRFLWLAVVLSFAFYIPVVLFSAAVPVVGVLMIPKTIAYVWIVLMGFFDQKKQLSIS